MMTAGPWGPVQGAQGCAGDIAGWRWSGRQRQLQACCTSMDGRTGGEATCLLVWEASAAVDLSLDGYDAEEQHGGK